MRWVTKAPSHGRTLRESPKPRAENAHETRARCLEPSRPKRLRAEAVRRRYRAFLFRRFRRQRGSSSKSPRTPAEYMYAAKEPGPGLSRGDTNGSMSRSRNARARTDDETVWGLRACIMHTARQPLCQRAAAWKCSKYPSRASFAVASRGGHGRPRPATRRNAVASARNHNAEASASAIRSTSAGVNPTKNGSASVRAARSRAAGKWLSAGATR